MYKCVGDGLFMLNDSCEWCWIVGFDWWLVICKNVRIV